MKVVVTGANGNLGCRLIEHLRKAHDVCAIVRSATARDKLAGLYPQQRIIVANYTSEQALAIALDGYDAVVHLVGIIKESAASSFENAHEDSCRTLLSACAQAGVKKIVYLSIVGASIDSDNQCLASKARAEKLLQDSSISSSVIKVPMVLGQGDFASFALKKNARASFAFTFRAGRLEQPIYAGDVITAIVSALALESMNVNLAGTESLTHKALILRAARVLGTSPTVISLPVSLGLALAQLLEYLPNPPVTRAMLGVLDHDDQVDVEFACQKLNVKLTSLDETLQHVLQD